MNKRKYTWIAGLWLLLLLIVSLSVVNMYTVEAATPKKISSYTVKIGNKNVKKKTYSVVEGKKVTIKTKVKPTKALRYISYKTSNSKVAVVDKKGVVTAKKNGTAKITIKIKAKNGKTITTWVKIKVTIPKMAHVVVTNKGVNVWKKTMTLDKGQSAKIDVAVTPANSKKSVTFTSQNSAVATVDQRGNIYANGPGTTQISIVIKPRTGASRTTYVNVNVVETRQYCLLMEKGTRVLYVPEGFTQTMTVVSSNPSVISVGTDNTLTAKNYGTSKLVITGQNRRDYIIMTVPDVSANASGSQLTLPSVSGKDHTFTVYRQSARNYGDFNEYLAKHGCANCSMTIMLTAYAPGFANATPDSIITGIEKQVAGETIWTENHVTTAPEYQRPVSLYGISHILKAAGVNNTYIQRFDENNDAAAALDIVEHLKTGNAVVYEVRQKNRYTGVTDTRWTGNFHTYTMLGYFVDGRVLITDTANRSWYKASNGYYGGQRFKIVDLKDAMSHMFSCTNDPQTNDPKDDPEHKYVYFKGTTKAGGYIKVNP